MGQALHLGKGKASAIEVLRDSVSASNAVLPYMNQHVGKAIHNSPEKFT
jgi:hypothetical protein